jgi:hypothetical protein
VHPSRVRGGRLERRFEADEVGDQRQPLLGRAAELHVGDVRDLELGGDHLPSVELKIQLPATTHRVSTLTNRKDLPEARKSPAWNPVLSRIETAIPRRVG